MMRTPVALPPILKGWSRICQSVVVSHKLPPLKNALQRKQRSYASKLKAPHRGVERDVLLRKARRAETASTYDRVAGLDAKHQDKF
jgi:hypothetical protein